MEQIILGIMHRIAEEMPELSLIDEDYGQLETEEDTYPVTFPCALISNMSIEWTTTKALCQRGKAEITTRLAIDCYDDTHLGSSQEHAIAERQRMAMKLDRALHGFQPQQNTGILLRTKTTQYAIRGGIKVYEITFTLSMHDGKECST